MTCKIYYYCCLVYSMGQDQCLTCKKTNERLFIQLLLAKFSLLNILLFGHERTLLYEGITLSLPPYMAVERCLPYVFVTFTSVSGNKVRR